MRIQTFSGGQYHPMRPLAAEVSASVEKSEIADVFDPPMGWLPEKAERALTECFRFEGLMP